MTSFPVPSGVVVLTGYNGVPRDPQPDSITVEEAGNGVVGRWPDGTEKNINAPTAATSSPRPLTPNQVVDLILAAVGPAGFAACVRSDLDAMVTWRYKMSVARDISKDQAASGLSIIVASGLMTAEQRTAILAAWPTM
jgi:hypothetical protein